MVKRNESDGSSRGPRRRRPERGARQTYQWGEVDDQAQDDLIEPVVVSKRKSGRPARRHDHDVNTLFVSNADDPFAPVRKRKPIKQKQAEDYADFVADVDPNEDDPYAIPSYGSTTLTQDDKELVEELAEPAERPERGRRQRQQRQPREERQQREERPAPADTEADAPKERPARKPRAEKPAKPAKPVVDEAASAAAPAAEPVRAEAERPAAPAPKRSIFSKIKEAASGLAATVAAAEADVAAAAEPVVLSRRRLSQLTRGAQKALDASGVSTNLKLGDSNQSQIEVLANVVEALLNVNLTLLDRVNSASPAAEEAHATEKPAREKPQRQKQDARRAEEHAEEHAEAKAAPAPAADDDAEEKPAESSRRRSRRNRRNDDEPAAEARETVENRQEEAAEEKPARRANGRKRAEEPAAPSYEDDPFAFWESIEDDDFEDSEEKSEPKSARSSRSRDYDDSDLDDCDGDESKKKSATRRKQTASTPELTDASAADEAADDADSNPADPDAERSRSSRRRRGSKTAAADSDSADAADDARKETSAKDASRPDAKPLEKFGELQLKKETLKALRAMGYSAPTPIQAGTIPTIQTGVDVMGQARTGTGKTAAFMIPLVEGVSECEPGPKGAPLALAVVPTRELAVQVRDEAQKIAQFYNLRVEACYGGKPIASQVEKLRRGVDILVGTPGRIIDLMNRYALSLDCAHWVVLDEADRMLDIGFRPDVEKILRRTPRSRQTLLFSATLAPPVVSLAKSYMKDPKQFDFSPNDVSAETIEQFYMTVDQDRKFDALVKLLQLQDPHQAIVFCRTKRHVDVIARRLGAKFDSVEAIHGDLPQTKRDHIMRDFRAEKTRFLVATDVIGRGIDVSTVSHIVNFDIPQYCDDYVHRVGRTGRMGREGVAFTLVTTEEGSELTRIEIRIGRQLERYELPDFEAFSRPSESADAPEPEHKPVFGRMTRRVRRAL